MASLIRSDQLETVVKDTSTSGDHAHSSPGKAFFLSQFKQKYERGLEARQFPRSLALLCCYVALFFAGFQQHGVSTVFTSIILNSFQLQPVYGISFSLLIFGIPYAFFSLPAYFLGRKFGYKWAVITGQVLVYLYSLYNMLDCSLSRCVYKWQTEGVSTIAFSLLFFCLSLPLLSLNLTLLGLEQIQDESSETKSVCIHWMWLVFLLGRLVGTFTGSAIFWWTFSAFLFVIQLTVASTAICVIIWAPLEKHNVGPLSVPFKTLWQVTKEASKHMCERKNKEFQRKVDVLETYDPDYKPNAFEKASEDFSGPLPTQDVRDVQKFYLILFMLVSLVGIWIFYSLLSTAFVPEVSKMSMPGILLDSDKSFSFWANESGKMVYTHEPLVPLTWNTNTFSDLTAVLTILILDRLVYPIFIVKLNIRRRITIGVLFGFLSGVAAVTTEATRTVNLLSLNSANTSAIMNRVPSVFSSGSVLFLSAQVSVYWVVPQYLLYGVMVAFVMPGADELALIAAPAEMQAFLFGVSHTLLGVSQIIAALFILMQNSPTTYWCFFCYLAPRTGILTFILTAAAMFLLFPVYLVLSRLYRKLELGINKPRNPDILPEDMFRGGRK